jgi:thymidylate synthase
MMAEITDMYGADDSDAPEVTQQVKRVVTNTGGLVEFEVNGTRVRTVDPGYVAMLENRLIRTEQEIDDLRNEISRIHNSMRSRRAETAQLQRQLDGKIDRQ